MILVYHHVEPRITASATDDPSAGWQFNHSPQGFERQLRALLRRGWRFVALGEIVASIREDGREPARRAAITFDDGWRDNYHHAFPVLSRLGLTATFFLTSANLRAGPGDARKMTLQQVRELAASGMTIGGHTRTHPDLTRLGESAARDEIAGCKADLEELLARPVELFAYPGGAFNRRVAELTREAGFAAACSVLGPARNDRSSLFWLFRDVISEAMDTPGDRYRLSGLARRLLEWRVRRRLRERLG